MEVGAYGRDPKLPGNFLALEPGLSVSHEKRFTPRHVFTGVKPRLRGQTRDGGGRDKAVYQSVVANNPWRHYNSRAESKDRDRSNHPSSLRPAFRGKEQIDQ